MKQYRLYLVHQGVGGVDYRNYHGRILSAEDLVVAKLKNPEIKYTEISMSESDPYTFKIEPNTGPNSVR